jgi:hypothetical protein
MSQQLISRSPDLKQLRDEGYDIEVRSAHLLVKSVPYVNSKRNVRRGTLVVPLGDVSGDKVNPPADHTAFFKGEHPCRSDGSIIREISHSSETKTLATGVVVNHMFSAKPKPEGKYRNYYHKMTTYAGILAGPAQSIDPNARPQTSIVAEPLEEESPFNYLDTSSTRAGISAVTSKIESKKIAIIGIGGTGSYVLDLVAKTPVNEIHLFDGDVFSNHNAFRSPGAPSLDELKERPSKVAYFSDRYTRMHRRICAHEAFLDEKNIDQLRPMDFVFLCLDRGADKRLIVDRLEAWQIAFIDVGMGVDVIDDKLRGSLRVTTNTPQKRDHFSKRVPFSDADAEDDYSRNIQIAELNALNAALAVIKWKKLWGFYQDCSVYTINGNHMANEDQV